MSGRNWIKRMMVVAAILIETAAPQVHADPIAFIRGCVSIDGFKSIGPCMTGPGDDWPPLILCTSPQIIMGMPKSEAYCETFPLRCTLPPTPANSVCEQYEQFEEGSPIEYVHVAGTLDSLDMYDYDLDVDLQDYAHMQNDFGE